MSGRFAKLVRDARSALSMSQEALATAAGITARTVMRVEAGANPSPESVMALCSVLGIPTGQATLAVAGDREGQLAPDVILPASFGPESDADRAVLVETAKRTITDLRMVFASDLAAISEQLLSDAHLGSRWAKDGPCRNEGAVDALRLRAAATFFSRFIDRIDSWQGALVRLACFATFLVALAFALIGAMAGVGVAWRWLVDGFGWAGPLSAAVGVAAVSAIVVRYLLRRPWSVSAMDVDIRVWVVRSVGSTVFAVTEDGIVRLARGKEGVVRSDEFDARLIAGVRDKAGPLEGTRTWTVTTIDGRDFHYADVPDDERIGAEFKRLASIAARFERPLDDMRLAS